MFALLAYRVWNAAAAIAAGAVSAAAMATLDLTLYYAGAGTGFFTIYALSSVVSGALLAGLGSVGIRQGLVRAGALRA